MDFESLLGKMFSDGVAWVSEGKWLKLYLAFLGAFVGALVLGGLFLFGSIFAAGYKSPFGTSALSALLAGGGVLGLVILVLVFIPAMVFLNIKLFEHALRFQGYEPVEITLPVVLKFVALGIYAGLSAVLCWKEKKWLGFGAAALFFAVGAIIVSPWLLVLGFLLALPYIYGVVKHAVKYSLSQFYFIRGRGVRESVQNSWDATAGLAWKIFGALLVFSIALGIAQQVVASALGLIPYLGWFAIFALNPALGFVQTYGTSGLYALVDRERKQTETPVHARHASKK